MGQPNTYAAILSVPALSHASGLVISCLHDTISVKSQLTVCPVTSV